MIRRVALASLVLVVVVGIALYLWASSVFSHDNVRTTLALELSKALRQPVTIGEVGATIYPRVTVRLHSVSVGAPARIQIGTLDLGTDFRALLSRKIEHATARVQGVRVELPLPPLGSSSRPESPVVADANAETKPPVELISIDHLLFRDITVVSGGRTLKVDIDAVPKGNGVVLRRLAISADDTSIEATGEISDLSGPVGTIAMQAGELDFDRLITFLNDFSRGASASAEDKPRETRANGARVAKTHLTVTIDAARAKSGAIVLEQLKGRATVTETGVAIDPVSFGIFGGRYDGALTAKLTEAAPAFRFNAKVSDIDVAALAAVAGSGNRPLTGRLVGTIDLTGAGAEPAAAMKSARGKARVDITNGAIKGLQLVRTVVLATSMRADSTKQSLATNPEGEAFKRLGATLAIAGGAASTQDLSFEAADVDLKAAGGFTLDGSDIKLRGLVQLSPELSQQAGRDLLRYTAQDNRVTLPATVSGSAENISVKIDLADATKRAVTNRAKEEIQRGIVGLLRRKPQR